jgi:hypothetical protein
VYFRFETVSRGGKELTLIGFVVKFPSNVLCIVTYKHVSIYIGFARGLGGRVWKSINQDTFLLTL